MDDVAVLLARDFGIRQQGKSAPMSTVAAGGSARSSAPAPSPSQSRSGSHPNDSLVGGSDDIFAALSLDSNPSTNGHPTSSSPPSLDSIFDAFKDSGPKASSFYVDDIFGGGIPGVKSTTPLPNYTAFPPYDDLLDNFGMATTPGPRESIGRRSGEPKDDDLFGFDELKSTPNQSYDDLLDNLGRKVPEERSDKHELPEFDELIPGFGRPQKVAFPETKQPPSRWTMPEPKRSPEEKDSSGFVELIPGFGRSIPQRSSVPLKPPRNAVTNNTVTIAPPFIDTTSTHKVRARHQSPRVDPIAIAKARQRAAAEAQEKASQRAAEALAEKIERDMEAQWEQEERRRIAAEQEAEIKRWAAGKEGNLRALLSTLQDVLWPECGWQPVSLVDLITSSSVKKVYRKASLCVHPDKVQQKGATLQQKCIAEKVFDLLKEAWNKFNSEELQRG